MIRNDIARFIADKHPIVSVTHAKEILGDVVERIRHGLETEGRVEIRGLGIFKVVTTKPRRSNLNAGQSIPAQQRVKFQASSVIKEALQQQTP